MIDPYGWSGPPGSGEDPWTADQAFGTLFAIRLGTLSGSTISTSEGTLSASLTPEGSPVTSFALAGNRIGEIYTAGGVSDAYVKDGTLGASWNTPQFTAATHIALSGRRIAVTGSNGNVEFKDGDLNAAWTLVATGCTCTQIAVESTASGSVNRVGFLSGGYFILYDNGIIYLEAYPGVKSIALGAGWMGFVDANNVAQVKQGVNDAWTAETPNASGATTFLSLGGGGDDRRIGVVRGGQGWVRVGSLTGTWYGEWTNPANASEIRVNSGRVGILTTGGAAS